MENLKYKAIKTKTQYKRYCNELEKLVGSNSKKEIIKDEIELLNILIEKWDSDHNSFSDLDPITLIKELMSENNLKAKDLVEILGVNKSLVSDILNYKKSISKQVIRILASHFKMSQEAFNRPYIINGSTNEKVKTISRKSWHNSLARPARIF